MDECRVCKGSGLAQIICPQCGGEGSVVRGMNPALVSLPDERLVEIGKRQVAYSHKQGTIIGSLRNRVDARKGELDIKNDKERDEIMFLTRLVIDINELSKLLH